MPSYTDNLKVNFSREKENLQRRGGRNCPVGTVWTDLTEPITQFMPSDRS